MSAILQAFKDADLRKKILISLALIILYRIGAQIPSPGVDYVSISARIHQLTSDSQGVYALINLFSGGALLQLSIFAIGVMPYITASIIVQLLTVVIPRFEELKKEGQSGQAKMDQYTRYLTLALALLQSSGIVALADREQLLGQGTRVLKEGRTLFDLIILVLVMSAGAVLVMWLGEIITERGVGNGMSLLIFAGIATRIPADGANILHGSGGLVFSLVLAAVIILVVGVVFVEQGQRRIPVQYAKRMVGRRQYGGSTTYIPIKINTAGVIPVIFASSILSMPQLFAQFSNTNAGWVQWIHNHLRQDANVYLVAYSLLILFFTFFYTAITFNPEEIADNMKKYGGFIPGIRAGEPTVRYLSYVINRVTVAGSVYLVVLALLPTLAVSRWLGLSSSLPFGGTTILIMVGVGLQTVKEINSQLQQRHYEGFLS